MNAGEILLQTSFLAALAAAAMYSLSLARENAPSKLAGWLYGYHATALLAAVILLCGYFLGHRFEYNYVAQYSSKSLSPALCMAAAWAGQEGSILLWAMLAAAVGVALLRQPGSIKRPAMFFVSLTQAALMLLILIRSPFQRVAVAPLDGQGLNPLLEDPWMIAHPPSLFIGYAALLAPFALAAAALVRRDYKDWARMTWPWALFAVVTLGLGIGMGGVWAYKVLGWGGYWGWDPVENASLIPWLISVALVHGLLIQRVTQSVTRTNLLLGVLGWLTVLGGTFLTRSGVLSDISVHSFADTGLKVPLLSLLGISTVFGLGMLALRWKSFDKGRAHWNEFSRASALWLGLLTVLVLAALVSLGTLTPLITRMFGAPASVENSFYNKISLPLAVLMTLLMALGPVLRWGATDRGKILSGLMPSAVLALALTAGAYLRGVHDPGHLLLAAIAGMAFGVNAVTAVRLFRRGWSYGAGYLGHLGIAIMVLGMVFSAALSKSERVRLVQGTPTKALDMTLTYSGMDPGPKGARFLNIKVQGPSWSVDARPALLPSPRGEGVMRKPAVNGRHDLYVSPVDIEATPEGESGAVWLKRGEEMTLGGVSYKFIGFRMTSHDAMQVYADLEATQNGKTIMLSPGIKVSPSGREPIDVESPGGGVISLSRIDADGHRAEVSLPGALQIAPPAIVEVSSKPFINLVWIGALITLLGTGLAGARRAAEKARGTEEKAAA